MANDSLNQLNKDMPVRVQRSIYSCQYFSYFHFVRKRQNSRDSEETTSGHRAAPGNPKGALSGGDELPSQRATHWSDARPRASDKGDDQFLEFINFCATQAGLCG